MYILVLIGEVAVAYHAVVLEDVADKICKYVNNKITSMIQTIYPMIQIMYLQG